MVVSPGVEVLGDGGLRFSVTGAVASITLDRPATRNAMTVAMWRALPGLIGRTAEDDGIRAVLLTGAGGAFCTGADVSEFPTAFADAASAGRYNALVEAGRRALADLPKPTIAVVPGLAVGAGCGLAMACDLRFAAEGARFGMPPARLGAAYPFAGLGQLVGLVGPSRAKDMLYSGRLVDADEALRIGLNDRVLPDETLMDAAQSYAEGVVALSSNAHRITKRMIQAIEQGTREETAELREMFETSFASDDFREGYQAFLEKRKPAFR